MNKSKFFTSEQRASLDPLRIPKHIAVIPDGNRRWAQHNLTVSEKGHRSGASVLIETVKAAKELGVKTITFYLFSTENWTRSQEEIDTLMWLLKEFLNEQCAEMLSDGVRLRTIGDLTKLPSDVLEVVAETSDKTAHCTCIDMVMALNYGSRDEMCRAFDRILTDCYSKKVQMENITESLISKYLDTAPWGDPELLIRTSGEMRLSNFLLWQLSYAEIYITNTLWPDFKSADLLAAILDFQGRKRRLGGT